MSIKERQRFIGDMGESVCQWLLLRQMNRGFHWVIKSCVPTVRRHINYTQKCSVRRDAVSPAHQSKGDSSEGTGKMSV